MKLEVREYLENKQNLYVNVHKDKFINETEKSLIAEIDDNTIVFIPKSIVLEKHKYFNYVRVYIDTKNQFCLNYNNNIGEKDYLSGLEVFMLLLKSNQKVNKVSSVYQALISFDKDIFN